MTFSPALLSSDRMDWNSPAVVLDRVRQIGDIALDPCTSPSNPVGATTFITPPADGLAESWCTLANGGLVYVNSPYGSALPHWVEKYAVEAMVGTEIVMLVPARTDTRWWKRAWDSSKAVCFWQGRIKFEGAANGAPFPSALLYTGSRVGAFMTAFSDKGRVVVL